jgi:hypothetical protein
VGDGEEDELRAVGDIIKVDYIRLQLPDATLSANRVALLDSTQEPMRIVGDFRKITLESECI